ncbi:MAG: formylglycine-generating enzyme family protein, partial [bacterium]|nr:formylglycine-generating enzyme family protein [bacterium]
MKNVTSNILLIALTVLALMTFGVSVSAQEIAATAMCTIPAGEFTMGYAEDTTGELLPHTVYVSSFQIDKYEVTNAQYHAFCIATERSMPTFWG